MKNVVCELRFPTLIEIDRGAMDGFRKAMRKTLPVYEAPHGMRLSPIGQSTPEIHHIFQTKGRDWTLTFKPDALGLESARYKSFDDMAQLLKEIIAHATPIIDADFFTRVGLRYINAVPISNDADIGTLSEWINPALVTALAEGVYGTVQAYMGDVRGRVEGGEYRFRHGLQGTGNRARAEYVLDFDFYAEGVEIPEVFDRLASFADDAYSFFMWTLGVKARHHLLAPAKG